MCCLFTCFGWLVDVIQRFWTFLMSCIICAAVYCMLVTTAMAGIAMGYNYSLSEYIDVKETNVSVFLKRGVFDDALADEMTWRRSAKDGGVSSFRDSNEINDADLARRSGRRLEDSILQSNEHNQFEGSLMKLTARPPAATQSREIITSSNQLAEAMDGYAGDSLDQLKAIQSLIKSESNHKRATINNDKTSTPNRNVMNMPGGRRVFVQPDSPDQHQIYADKQAIPYEHSTFRINPARFAVPDPFIGDAPSWFGPKILPPSFKRKMDIPMYDNIPSSASTYPSPIKYRTGVHRPTLTNQWHHKTTEDVEKELDLSNRREFDTRRENEEINRVKNNLLLDKSNFPSFRKSEYKNLDENALNAKSAEIDYEEEAVKGLPVRQKRHLDHHIKNEDTKKENERPKFSDKSLKDIDRLDKTLRNKIDSNFKLNASYENNANDDANIRNKAETISLGTEAFSDITTAKSLRVEAPSTISSAVVDNKIVNANSTKLSKKNFLTKLVSKFLGGV